MGWMESPPSFCVTTEETIADIANGNLRHKVPATPHRLRLVANTSPSPGDAPVLPPLLATAHQATAVPTHPPGPHKKPVQYIDLYMDNLIGLAQGGPKQNEQCKSARKTWNSIFLQQQKMEGANYNPQRQRFQFLMGATQNGTRKINKRQEINFLEWELYFSDWRSYQNRNNYRKKFDFLNGNKIPKCKINKKMSDSIWDGGKKIEKVQIGTKKQDLHLRQWLALEEEE
jgi:hypothetical protein